MKVGDCVKVDYNVKGMTHWNWIGVCTWTDGYKFEFLIDGEFDTWTTSDLDAVDAEVINEH